MGVTLRDVAREAQVSTATVSRVINGHGNVSDATRERILGVAERLDLDIARFTAEMDDHVYLQRVREDLESGVESGVRGTPTFFVNGRIEDVSFGLRTLFDAVEAHLHPAPGS